MKTLRYLLIVVAMVGFLSVNAQETSQSQEKLPEVKMQSTSVMQGSGSTLPMAARDCDCFIFVDEEPSSRQNVSGPRKGRPGDWTDPYKDPIGDGMIPLALCAGAYLIWRVVHRRRREDALVNKTK